MIKRPYINKRGRLVLGEEQKKHKETKRQMFDDDHRSTHTHTHAVSP